MRTSQEWRKIYIHQKFELSQQQCADILRHMEMLEERVEELGRQLDVEHDVCVRLTKRICEANAILEGGRSVNRFERLV